MPDTCATHVTMHPVTRTSLSVGESPLKARRVVHISGVFPLYVDIFLHGDVEAKLLRYEASMYGCKLTGVPSHYRREQTASASHHCGEGGSGNLHCECTHFCFEWHPARKQWASLES
jgi:hypothetical protein